MGNSGDRALVTVSSARSKAGSSLQADLVNPTMSRVSCAQEPPVCSAS